MTGFLIMEQSLKCTSIQIEPGKIIFDYDAIFKALIHKSRFVLPLFFVHVPSLFWCADPGVSL